MHEFKSLITPWHSEKILLLLTSLSLSVISYTDCPETFYRDHSRAFWAEGVCRECPVIRSIWAVKYLTDICLSMMKYKSWICFMPASGSFSLSLWSKYWQRISPQKACFYSLKLPRIRSLAESMFLSYIQKLNLVLFPNSAYNKRADNQLSSRCLHLIRWILSPPKLLPQLLDQRLLNSFIFYCEYILLHYAGCMMGCEDLKMNHLGSLQ